MILSPPGKKIVRTRYQATRFNNSAPTLSTAQFPSGRITA